MISSSYPRQSQQWAMDYHYTRFKSKYEEDKWEKPVVVMETPGECWVPIVGGMV